MLFDIHHLKKTNITYFSHGIRVIKISVILIALGIIGIIHGLFPFVFIDNVSNGIKKVADEIAKAEKVQDL